MKKQNQIKNIFKSSDITQTQVVVEKQSTLFDKITLKLFNLYKKMLPPENLEEANSRIDALKSDNSLYKMFFESMTEAVGVISPLGNILFTNHRIPAILCYSEKEIIGNNIFELLDKNNQVIIIKQLIKRSWHRHNATPKHENGIRWFPSSSLGTSGANKSILKKKMSEI